MLSAARLVPIVCLLVVIAGCTQPEPVAPEPAESVAPEPGPPTLAWRGHPFLGAILVDDDGRSLYIFTGDPAGNSSCVGACGVRWPPALVEDAVRVDASLEGRVSTLVTGEGGSQLAIDGRPLYRYVDDAAPGDANGQGREGAWFVVRGIEAPGQRNVDFLDGPGKFQVNASNVTFGRGTSGFLARPAGNASVPGVVMIHEWWGLNEHIKTMARALASHGYAVLAVDLYDGEVATTADEARALVDGINPVEATGTIQYAVWHLLDDEAAPSVATLGWCFGGGQSLRFGVWGVDVDATILYYGSLDHDDRDLGRIEGPVLGIFGAEDRSIPLSEVRAFERALKNASVKNEIHVYEGVGHAFANPSGDAYAPAQAMDAWAKTLAFLRAHAPTSPASA